jgi:hypothetical protein
LLFIVLFLVQGATRTGYSALRHPISSLSIGPMGWVQSANFIITGLLILAFAVGLRSVLRHPKGLLWGPLLIGIVGIGLIGAGFFTTDPLAGYPPGTPLLQTERTLAGRLHDLFSLPVFLALPAACFVFMRYFARRRNPRWSVYSFLSGLGMLAAFVLAGMGFQQTPGFAEVAGLYQRLSIGIGWVWMALLALHFFRNPSGQTGRRQFA